MLSIFRFGFILSLWNLVISLVFFCEHCFTSKTNASVETSCNMSAINDYCPLFQCRGGILVLVEIHHNLILVFVSSNLCLFAIRNLDISLVRL